MKRHPRGTIINHWKPDSNALERLDILKAQLKVEGKMTLRRCHYILVSQTGLAKVSPKSYKSVVVPLLKKAREAGLFPWDGIIDETRPLYQPETYGSFDQALEALYERFTLDVRKNIPLVC